MITPGKWKREPWTAKESQVVSSYGGKRSLICAGVLNADARLIANAPEMANLLRELMSEESPQPGSASWATKVQDLLIKIDGDDQ